MRFGGNSARAVISISLKKKIYEKILMTNLDLSSNEAKHVLDNKSLSAPHRCNVLGHHRHRVINNCLILQKYNVDAKPLENLRYCLGLNSFKLEHRINILKDMGVPEVNTYTLHKLVKLLNKSMRVFKKHTKISSNQSVSQNILHRLNKPQIDISHLELKLNDNIKAREYYDHCLLYFKTEILDLSFLDDNFLLTGHHMRCKSISMIAETLKVLRLELNYDDKLIKKHPFIITASADNIKSLLNDFKDTGICGMPIVQILKKYTFMLFANTDNIKQLLASFKQYEIKDEFVKKYIKILLIDNIVFLERIEAIKKHPDLHLWHKYPRILQMIFQKNMVYDRVGYLRLLNRMKWARLHTMLSSKQHLEKHIQYGSSTFISRKSLTHVLGNELGLEKSANLMKLLMRHPYWKTVGFTDIEQMLQYLKKSFTTSEICQNIHIILYARPIVDKLLAKLRQEYSQSVEFSFTNSQYLALCLYMLEKDNHFTGDGIWNKDHNAKQNSYLLENSSIDSNNIDTSIENNTDDDDFIFDNSNINTDTNIDITDER